MVLTSVIALFCIFGLGVAVGYLWAIDRFHPDYEDTYNPDQLTLWGPEHYVTETWVKVQRQRHDGE